MPRNEDITNWKGYSGGKGKQMNEQEVLSILCKVSNGTISINKALLEIKIMFMNMQDSKDDEIKNLYEKISLWEATLSVDGENWITDVVEQMCDVIRSK